MNILTSLNWQRMRMTSRLLCIVAKFRNHVDYLKYDIGSVFSWPIELVQSDLAVYLSFMQVFQVGITKYPSSPKVNG